ncbi:hypothetical protein ACFPH6_19150 [Streptomyces xiangluensis]|uniref:Uncharacterized protein n=1 Tax=Streptomyces xiangluensis TaxID=2665720 RepID=A0ABV8YQS0_9ACTN
MAEPRNSDGGDDEEEERRPWYGISRWLAGFFAAIPFAGVISLVQDWFGKRISSTQTGLLSGILIMLAFLVYGVVSSALDGAREARLTRAKVAKLSRETHRSFDEFRERVGSFTKYYPARHGPVQDHYTQAARLYEEAGKVIDSARDGDEIYAVNSFVEIFHQDPDPEIERLQDEYLDRIERCLDRRVKYHRLIQLENLQSLDSPSSLLSDWVEKSYLRHYRRSIERRSEAAGNIVDVDAVPAKYPISFVVLKRKAVNGVTGGSIIWQINEHVQRNGQLEAAHLQLTGIFIIRNPQGDLTDRLLDLFQQCNRHSVQLTLHHLRDRNGGNA